MVQGGSKSSKVTKVQELVYKLKFSCHTVHISPSNSIDQHEYAMMPKSNMNRANGGTHRGGSTS